MMLELLKKRNTIPVHSVSDEAFRTYGCILEGYDFSSWFSYMKSHTKIPKEGNIYEASVSELEALEPSTFLRDTVYGGMGIEVGYCNGRNSTLNGLEYHKGSEINIAGTDFVLLLGHLWDVKENRYQADRVKAFFVGKGTAIELYQTTLHLSPCKINDDGFRDIVVLQRGTNTPLQLTARRVEGENRLLLMKNKWMVAHPDRKSLIEQGAFPGLIGGNLLFRYQ